MSLGARVRALAGPFEPALASLYRGIFFDVGAFADAIRERVAANSILEIGCGEGALVEELSARFPLAAITGIDPSPRVGRLFRGDRTRIAFHQESTGDIVRRRPAAVDLVVICDVLHHVPWSEHRTLLETAADTLTAGGVLVVKEWERRATPIHALGYISDRFVTGDRIRYGRADELRRRLTDVFGPRSIEGEIRVRPWKNNVAFFLRPERRGREPK